MPTIAELKRDLAMLHEPFSGMLERRIGVQCLCETNTDTAQDSVESEDTAQSKVFSEIFFPGVEEALEKITI